MEQLCAQHDHHRVLLMLSVFSVIVLGALFIIVLYLAMVGETMHEFIRRLRGRKPKKTAGGEIPMRDLAGHAGVEGGGGSSGQSAASWRTNMEFLFGPIGSWWRWLLPLAPLHRSARKVS